jgi:hypothetical protein
LLKDKPIYYSIDLTAATDRMPLSLQKDILARLTSPEFSMAWGQLLVDLPFTVGDLSLKYQAGQPMGAYSS